MSSSSSSSSSVNIQALLRKTEHYDKDERYMATSDLCEVLKRHSSERSTHHHTNTSGTTNASSASNANTSSNNNNTSYAVHNSFLLDHNTEQKICSAVLRLLHDTSHDVQAIAVKTLGVLLTTVQQEFVLEIADSLCNQVLDTSKWELRDVYGIGLRTLITTIPERMGDSVAQRLVPRVLEGIRVFAAQDIVLLCLDVLRDVLDRFGSSSGAVTRQHEAMLVLLLSMQQQSPPQELQQQELHQESSSLSSSHVVSKRAGTTLGRLSVVVSDVLLARMVESLLTQIWSATSTSTSTTTTSASTSTTATTTSGTDTRALIRTMCTVASAVGHRLQQTQIDRIVPLFLQFCKPAEARTGDDEDEDDDGDMQDEDDMDMEQDNEEQDQDMDADEDEDDVQLALKNELRESCFTGFEAFVARCPTEVEPHLDEIISAALAYMSYDPNYSYGNDDEDEDIADGDEDEEDEFSEDELEDDESEEDDDDDDSWKVRRSAIRALAAVVESKKHDPAVLWNKTYAVRRGKKMTVASALVGRFKEREENCRVDIIDCFTRLLSVTVQAAKDGVMAFASPDAMDTDVVVDLRTQYGPALVKACEKLLAIKKGGERSKSSALALLSTLCLAPGGVGGKVEVRSVFQHTQTFLTVTGNDGNGFHHREAASKSLKLDALKLVRSMLECEGHNPVYIQTALLKTSLLSDVCASVQEKWYKVISEALRVLAEVPPIILAGGEDGAAAKEDFDVVASSLYMAIEPLLGAHDVDQEIKECALSASGALMSGLHANLSSEQQNRLLSLLLDRLRNETTRIAAIQTLQAIAASSGTSGMDDENKIDLSRILGDATSIMASFLKQQSRSLKQSSLEALDIIVRHHGSEDASLQDGALFSNVLEQVADLIVDSDLHLSHLSLRMSISILSECPACASAAKTHILPPALVLSTSPLLQDLALESLLALFQEMISSDTVEFAELLGALRARCDSDEKIGKHAVASVAKCMATITAATTVENRDTVVMNTLSALESATDMEDDAAVKQTVLSLRLSGDLGRIVDLSSLNTVAGRLEKVYLASFDASSEEVKHAAAYALGLAAFGAQTVFLPAIVNALETNTQKRQYLLLSSLREFIRCNLKVGGDAIAPSVPVILPHLLNHCADSEEGVRTMVAECMGTLACLQPAGMLQTLRDLVVEHSAIAAPDGHVAEGDEVSTKNALACWTATTSVKLAIAGKASAPDLAEFMPDYLQLLQQEELGVQNAALLMVYSAVHHMPQLVTGTMKELVLPALYQVSELKLERKVDLGPFTHTVDDALPLRKSALSIFATCLENLPGSLDIAAFMPVLARALADKEDVQLQAHQIVVSMCAHQPTYLVAAVESFVEPLEKTVNKKTSQKTGTELERANEWIKSALRATIALSHLDGIMSSRKFADFADRVKANAKFRGMLEALEDER